jgi:NADH-quinone oxidoreductase subunit J
MVLAHRERFEHRKSQRELSEERFRGVGRPTPLPGPGVYARRNAVDSAALLADGSYSELSVSSILQSRGADGAPTAPREAIPASGKGGAS